MTLSAMGGERKWLATYNDKNTRKYVHFVDGGITDNLGLRAITDVFDIVGGASNFLHFFNEVPTSFALNDEQVDKLIAAGRNLLEESPEFQQLLIDLGNEP